MRKYHEQRANARGLTTEFCLLLGVAVIGTIAVSTVAMAALATFGAYEYVAQTTTIKMPEGYWSKIFYQRLMQCGLFTAVAVVGTAMYQTWKLTEGGGRHLARLLGGTRITNPCEDQNGTRLLNIVDELAIATGIKAPAVFVLSGERGINAFAAGLDVKDAVIGVTQGAVERLKRNQLQGIIAHEFSHIINGDMRLNIQILGVLTGVQAITLAARFLLRLGMPNDDKGKHPLGMILAFVFGAALWPIGQIGSLFAMLIHFAVNRQREFLADASAVQYTRDPIGLCEALAALLDDDLGSRITGPQARLASHLFFASGTSSVWNQLFQSHPSVVERIRRLDPSLTA
jgi:Zn-dependent protease with chaperone function